jgi:prepilin-type N-terminal cleavage/methylation domain-containing protein
MHERRQSGFTVIELMVTLTVAAVLAGLAVPGFRDLIDKSKLRGATDDVVSLLNTARASAVKLQHNVSVSIKSSSWCAGAISASDPSPGDQVGSVAVCDCALDATDASACYIGGASIGLYAVVAAADHSGVTIKDVDSTIAYSSGLTFNSKFGALDLSNLPAGPLVTLVSPAKKFSTQISVSPLGQVYACSVGGKFISGYQSC